MIAKIKGNTIMKIHFVTSNSGKVKSLQNYFDFKGRNDVMVLQMNFNLIEPQADTVAEVSLSKAKQAFKALKRPVLVDDSGLCIDVLNGFPGVYAKYVYSTIGAEGIVKLMAGETNRHGQFIGTATYIDEKGKSYQFHRQQSDIYIADSVSPINSPLAWSVLWKICRLKGYDKVLSEMTADEISKYYAKNELNGTLPLFANWFIKNNEKIK